jgi:hypothetical protein
MALVGKTKAKGPKSAHTTAPSSYPDGTGGKGVKVVPGKGGAGRIGPDHCTAKRAASNVRSY